VIWEEDLRGAHGVGGGLQSYGLVLDLQGGQKGRRASRRAAPGVRRVSYPRATLRRRLLVLLGKRIRAPEPLAVRQARAVCGCGLDPDSLVPRVRVRSAVRQALGAQLDALPAPPRGYAVISPGASRRMKAIPPSVVYAIEERFARRGWGTIRLGPPGRGDARTPLVRRGVLGFRAEFRGELEEVAALMSLSPVVVSSDSGILHLATAVGTPAVGLFGPTAPELGFSPLGRSCAVGVDLACRPCHVHGPRFCWLGHERCWGEMDSAQVVAAAEALSRAGAERG
jgi:ADP-heptose:LPS heptosyltransferase